MSDGPQMYPPPGAPPPEERPSAVPPGSPAWGSPAPAAPAPGPAGWAPYPVNGGGPRPDLFVGAAHKPGAFALRPLGLGDMFDAAFRIIRFNPKATVGAAVLVTAVAMLVPVVITTVLTFTVGLSTETLDDPASAEASLSEVLGLLAAYGSFLLSYAIAFVGIALVTGMVVHVARAAAVGRRLDLGQAWAATHGKRWRLIGLTVLNGLTWLLLITVYVLLWVLLVAAGSPPAVLVLWGLVTVPAVVCLCVLLWVRAFYLSVPALMLEDVGVLGSIGRGWSLTSRQFWRTFGIALLTTIVASIGGSLLSTPLSLVAQFGSLLSADYGPLIFIVGSALALVVQNAFTAPFIASVTSLQYLDQRIRKEALDVELLREAGIIAA